jgi:hypothetical protein
MRLRHARAIALFACLLALGQVPAVHAQGTAPDPNPGALTLTAAIDAVTTYMFRGIRQNGTGFALQPYADVGVALFSGTGSVKSASLNVGTWNSLHTGDTGADSASGNMWYESDFYTTFSAGFGSTTVGSTFTAYTSPNAGFTTVREIAFRVGYDDSELLGGAAFHPYALAAFEFLTEPGIGQADGGDKAGRYLELGAAAGYALPAATIAVPVKLGLSLDNYYELRDSSGAVVKDSAFGFFSLAGIVTVPLRGTSRFGAFNVHGGVEYQRLGDTTRAVNAGDANKFIGSIGIGLAY